jgi:lysophospholipase L1-like esterase
MRAPASLLRNGALAACSVLFALATAELALRWLASPAPVSDLRGLHELRPDRPWLYGLRPGAEGRIEELGDAVYRINEDGFRGPRHARPRPAGGLRVLVLGDSVAFGYGVEEGDAFPRALERQLAELIAGRAVEVVNLGVGGYNAWNEAQLLADVGASYQPDLVVVQFCINDLNDPTVHFDAQTRIALPSIPDEAYPDPAKRRAPESAPSRLSGWCAASKLCTRTRELRLAGSGAEFDDADRRAAVLPVESDAGPEWSWLEARYLEMAASARAGGARFALLALPYAAQLDRPAPDPVQQRLVAMARRNGWTLVDPLPAFRAARAAGTELFLDWWHPTPAGHRLVAETLLATLACAGDLGAEAGAAGCSAGSSAVLDGRQNR